VNNSPYTSEPSLSELLTGLVNDVKALLQQELALAKHEIRAELRKMLRAVVSLGLGGGIAVVGGWLLILMLVHLLHALTALPLWVCYGIVGGLFAIGGVVLLVIGQRKLASLHLVPQDTAETMQENVQWIKKQVTANGTSERDRQRWQGTRQPRR
jgi:Putative Actinobacterial Holin-X, holin superfamily III